MLAALVDGSRAAILVLRADRRVLYANPAACLLLDRPFSELRDRDVLERVSGDGHAELVRRLGPRVHDETPSFTSIVRGVDEAEREVVGSVFTVQADGLPLRVLTWWDQTDARSATRMGAALVQTAAQVGTTSVDLMLTKIAQHVVEGTRATKCGLLVAGDDDRLSAGGAFCQGVGPGGQDPQASGSGYPGVTPRPATAWISAITAGAVLVGGAPDQPVLLTDARACWEADPITRDYARSIIDLPYRAALAIPLSWQNRVIGLCIVHLPSEVAVLTESELAFAAALADQATLAVMNARLSAQAGETAALRERARLARELHDSVIQALFSMTMHARAAQLVMENAGVDPISAVASSLDEITELIRDALAEMRALIFELRPGALADEGLVTALRHQAAALSARDGVTVHVEGPGARVVLDDEVEQQLYRITIEALHNVVKHAHATRVDVRLVDDADGVRLTVTDNGVGFDTQASRQGHLGLSTMAERARTIDARLHVDSRPGRGTSVTVMCPATLHHGSPPG